MNNGWKKIVIDGNADLHRSENCLLIIKGNESRKIPINHINSIIIESEQITLTSSLMIFLIENNVSVIFCDMKHNPSFEAVPFNKNTFSSKRLKEQIKWDEDRKSEIGSYIVELKIKNQANFLKRLGNATFVYLESLIYDIDTDNAIEIEAEAAKVYFRELFGTNFNRRIGNDINSALNYGYAVLLSNINRIVVSHGYNTSLGLNHHSGRNQFNLSCDIIEPFRPFVDEIVYENMYSGFDSEYKKRLLSVCSIEIRYNNSIITIENALDLFTVSVINRMKDNLILGEVIDFA